ncbi:hypothetical protein CVT25_012543 [Psilocybe cyanescens]|uniref:Uncharacterized protein n=1 Tax=Psilocybe cyanescens TaxID=93625 RepID=A0A409X137_PSICY|nr:hypothetical protein CVT25_012543 [Psilocybe cyanescens]
MTDSAERSISRGRDTFSTGRGGLGNIRQTSASRDARPSSGPDDFSPTRGREPIASPQQVFSTGRGGAGNLRSPSRAPKDAQSDAAEQEVIREYVASQEHAIKSSGRGGIGNISRSRSRGPPQSKSPSRPSPTTGSPAPAAGKFSTGRGGAGNILSGQDGHGHAGYSAEAADEEERRRVGLSANVHNAGG